MNRLEIKSQALTSEYVLDQINNIDEIASQYGLYGAFINFKNDLSLGSGTYLILSVEPFKDDFNPYKVSNNIKRDPDIFYPKAFAVQLTPDNLISAFSDAMDYCKDAEFLVNLYKEFDTKLPERIRHEEISGLKNWCDGRFNPDFPDSFRFDCAKGLKTFFKKENSIMNKEKREFYRSGRYDEKASLLERKSDFDKRDSPIVRLPVLLQSTGEVCKKKVGSGELDAFCNYIKNVYPDILFSVSEKEVIDNGLLEFARKNPNHPSLKQRPVTEAEFRKIIKERFATEGFNCTNDIQPAYWEFYDVYYKKIDEPQIITAYNDVYLSFADHDPLQILTARGPVNMIDLPVDDFHYFVALAKSVDLKFHIDHRGVFAAPSFSDIHVIYNTKDQETMNDIIDQMVSNDILNSHIVPQNDVLPPLNEKIQKAYSDLLGSPSNGPKKQLGFEYEK